MAGVFPDVTGICSINLNHDLYGKEDAIRWAINHGLLANGRVCRCSTVMSLRTRNNLKDGFVWRCPRCRNTKSIRCGSFYQNCHIPLSKCIMMTYYWSLGDISQASIGELLQLDSNHTIPDWFNMHRDLCVHWAKDHPIRIGGPGHVVQIGECEILGSKKPKRPTAKRWVFGGIDQGTKEAFLIEVPRTDDATIMSLIREHVLPGTIVWSNRWDAFKSLTALDGCDSGDPPMTFTPPNGSDDYAVENLWRCAKSTFKKRGTSAAQVSSHLDEFLWRRTIRDRSSYFQNVLQLIRTYYPV